MALLMLKEVSDWVEEHCLSGAAPAFSADGLVYRIEDEQEARAFRERWLLPSTLFESDSAHKPRAD